MSAESRGLVCGCDNRNKQNGMGETMSEAIRELIEQLRSEALKLNNDALTNWEAARIKRGAAFELEIMLEATSNVLDKPQPKGMKQ